jgi:hypothetical protein
LSTVLGTDWSGTVTTVHSTRNAAIINTVSGVTIGFFQSLILKIQFNLLKRDEQKSSVREGVP